MCVGQRVVADERVEHAAVVPTTLAEACRVASVSDCAVPVSAARWTTSSGRIRASRRVPHRRVGDVAHDQLDPSGRAAGRCPPGWTWSSRVSTATTGSPRSRRCGARAQPMKPAPPVTRPQAPAGRRAHSLTYTPVGIRRSSNIARLPRDRGTLPAGVSSNGVRRTLRETKTPYRTGVRPFFVDRGRARRDDREPVDRELAERHLLKRWRNVHGARSA